MKRHFFIMLSLLATASTQVMAQTDSNTTQAFLPDTTFTTAWDTTLQDTIARADSVPQKRIRINGFRVQVYYGGNDQKSKLEARKTAERVKIWFEDLKVYTFFSSPRWICRVGDFQTRDEAMAVLQAMRESGRFPKAIIVKSKITINENELRREEPADSCATRDTTAYSTNLGIAGRGPAEGGLVKDSTSGCQGND